MFVQEINKSFIRPHKVCVSRFKAVNQNILPRAEPVRHGHKIRPVRRFLDGHPPFQRRQIHDLIPELLVFCDRQIQLGQYAAEIKAFQEKWVKGRTYIYCVLGDEKDLDLKGLSQYGPIQKLTQEELFGY